MFKSVAKMACAFDIECIPDTAAGRLVYGLSEDMSEREVLEYMWKHARKREDDTRPFLKPSLYKIVTISALLRYEDQDQVKLHLLSLPADLMEEESQQEAILLQAFLDAVGKRQPQLIGFNSRGFDMALIKQRAVINGLSADRFFSRPEKPWEGVDYFSRSSDWHIDLMEVLAEGGWGTTLPSLHEIAVQSGIPGKFDVSGVEVVDLWYRGELRRIRDYNDFDAITTYLLWLRIAHLGPAFSDQSYLNEQKALFEYLNEKSEEEQFSHLKIYLEEWQRLRILRLQPSL